MNDRDSRGDDSIVGGKLKYKKPELAEKSIWEISSKELKKLDKIFDYIRK